MRITGFNRAARYATRFGVGLLVFIAVPEGVRWMQGGAIAQQAIFLNNTIIGNTINGRSDYSATGVPGQTGPVVGGESTVTVCPGQGGVGQNVIGTYVPPGSTMTATAQGGGGGSVTGYRSTVIVGGPGCR